jgi:hypothetical protein
VVGLKNIRREMFLDAAPAAASKILFNPFEHGAVDGL